jgi:hypothetical protein
MVVELLPGWYEVIGGRCAHPVLDGGYSKMTTTCGLHIRGAFRYRGSRLRQCRSCVRIDKRLSTGREVKHAP